MNKMYLDISHVLDEGDDMPPVISRPSHIPEDAEYLTCGSFPTNDGVLELGLYNGIWTVGYKWIIDN